MSVPGTPVNNVLNPRARARAGAGAGARAVAVAGAGARARPEPELEPRPEPELQLCGDPPSATPRPSSFFAYIAAKRIPRTDRILVFRGAFSTIRDVYFTTVSIGSTPRPRRSLAPPPAPITSRNDCHASRLLSAAMMYVLLRTDGKKHPFELSTK